MEPSRRTSNTMKNETRLVLGFVGACAGVFLVAGLLWYADLRGLAGTVLSLGGVAVFLTFGYLGFGHLTRPIESEDGEN